MIDNTIAAPRRRLTAHARVRRRSRIFAWLRDGWAYDEIAREEGVTAERIRQIVRKTLERRVVDDGADHAKLQLARLQPAMRLAGEAVADGDVKAIVPLLKVLDRLDRYQKVGAASQEFDDDARRRLYEKLNRVAANLGIEFGKGAAESEDAGKAESEDAGAAESEDAGKADGAGENEKNAPGVAATP